MNPEDDLDFCTARAVDDLLTLASQAVAAGRPELALSANAALDELFAYLLQTRPLVVAATPHSLGGSHAQH